MIVESLPLLLGKAGIKFLLMIVFFPFFFAGCQWHSILEGQLGVSYS
jgi:hypothetical protein